MSRKHISLEEYLQKVPQEYRNNIEILEPFIGNRTNIAFKFSCGCKIEQPLKSFLKRDNFDYCSKCKPKKPKEHKINDNSSKFIGMVQDQDFVICKICGMYAKKLAGHLRTAHGIKPEQYDGNVLCESSKKKYSNQNKDNGNWIEKAKARGEDLTEYKQRMGEAVRSAILSNPDERKRRAKVMSDVNKSDVMRKKASETAIKTSARKDIQENRSAQLQKWRNENPDEFYDKCTSKMMNPCWHSKPEMMLFDILKDIKKYKFKQNQVIKSDKFPTKSKRKQIDIGDKSKRTYVEFDGELHFNQTNLNQLDSVKEKDRLLDEHIIKHGWTLIRVGYDQFSYRKSDYGFNKECLEQVFKILDNPTPGVHRIGAVYNQIPEHEEYPNEEFDKHEYYLKNSEKVIQLDAIKKG